MSKKYKSEQFVNLDFDEIDPKEHFEISNYGSIKSFRTSRKDGKIIKGSFISGYNTVQVKLKNGKMKSYYVHKLVALFFLDKPNDNQTFVAHKDFDRKNNFYLNLMWVDRKGLSIHRLNDPDYNEKKIRNSKLTEENVKAILRRIKKLDSPTRQDLLKLAEKNSITLTQVRRIANRENWSHIKI